MVVDLGAHTSEFVEYWERSVQWTFKAERMSYKEELAEHETVDSGRELISRQVPSRI